MKRDMLIKRNVEDVLGWPTDTFAIEFETISRQRQGTKPTPRRQPGRRAHTIIMFVPGNPGLVEWYISFFAKILQSLGPGFAVRGASYAGHSTDPSQINVEEAGDAAKSMAWTIDGQVQHKISYIDKILHQVRDDYGGGDGDRVKLIFVGHSIGCHLVQRILMLRPDILHRTVRCIFLMPFIRMDAPAPNQQVLNWGAYHPATAAWILQALSRLLKKLHPQTLQDLLKPVMDKREDRKFTARLLRKTTFPRNFLGLGLEEIRDVPQAIDVSEIYRNINHEIQVPAVCHSRTMDFVTTGVWFTIHH